MKKYGKYDTLKRLQRSISEYSENLCSLPPPPPAPSDRKQVIRYIYAKLAVIDIALINVYYVNLQASR